MNSNTVAIPVQYKARPFSFIIHEGGAVTSFYFDPVFMIRKIKYLVKVNTPTKSLTVFYMEKTPFGWRIINAPKISDVYMQMESQLASLIEQSGSY